MGWNREIGKFSDTGEKIFRTMVRTTQGKNLYRKDIPETGELKGLWFGGYILPFLIFTLSIIYFYIFSSHIFYYQENLSLFVFSGEYLAQFTCKPGGLLVYAGNFLTQFYFSPFAGSLILATVFALFAMTYFRISEKLGAAKPFSLLFAAFASCVLILIQTNINYLIYNTLGFLFAGLFFLYSVSFDKKLYGIPVLIMFPLFFYISGGFAWVFLGMYLIKNLLNKKVVYSISAMIIAALTLLLFKKMVFLQPWSDLIYFPLLLKGFFNNPLILWFLYLFFVLYPALIILSGRVSLKREQIRTYSLSFIFIPAIITISILAWKYDKRLTDLFRLEEHFLSGRWDEVIREQEKSQSANPVAQYYYNIALSERGALCDRLFFGPQDYGPKSIAIPWNSQIPMIKMFRGVYFYYSIGLINEAHRWAFESMVDQGYRPENIKLLVKTDLINGHYKVAEKYIEILKRTLHYRRLALKFEAIANNPELISDDPELKEKIVLKPKDDFIVRIRDPKTNISLLLESVPGNRKAFEYEMAWQMLDKNLKGMITTLEKLPEMNYQRIPRHIEEAILFIESNIGPVPVLKEQKISDEEKSRFSAYLTAHMKGGEAKSLRYSDIPNDLRNTLWFYLEFVRPVL